LLDSEVKDKIMDNFLTDKLFSDKQFGFLKSRSTVSQYIIEYYGALDRDVSNWRGIDVIIRIWKDF